MKNNYTFVLCQSKWTRPRRQKADNMLKNRYNISLSQHKWARLTDCEPRKSHLSLHWHVAGLSCQLVRSWFHSAVPRAPFSPPMWHQRFPLDASAKILKLRGLSLQSQYNDRILMDSPWFTRQQPVNQLTSRFWASRHRAATINEPHFRCYLPQSKRRSSFHLPIKIIYVPSKVWWCVSG